MDTWLLPPDTPQLSTWFIVVLWDHVFQFVYSSICWLMEKMSPYPRIFFSLYNSTDVRLSKGARALKYTQARDFTHSIK